jgi:hypothetical protein
VNTHITVRAVWFTNYSIVKKFCHDVWNWTRRLKYAVRAMKCVPHQHFNILLRAERRESISVVFVTLETQFEGILPFLTHWNETRQHYLHHAVPVNVFLQAEYRKWNYHILSPVPSDFIANGDGCISYVFNNVCHAVIIRVTIMLNGSRKCSTWPRGYTSCWQVYTNKTRVMPFTPTKSFAFMSTSLLLGNVYTAKSCEGKKRDPGALKLRQVS